ncbi:MAG: hypothetical protein LIO81_02460 [Clostridiales bacterium]|nr:hypothetical protein [Clostridiales bacterium]
MLRLLETGRALYVLVAVCLLGILARLVSRNLYKGLIKESANLAATKNKGLKELKQRAENAYRMNQGMRDAAVWLEHQLGELHFRGFTLAGWGALSLRLTWLCLLLGGTAAFFSYWFRLDTYYIVMYGGGAVLMAMLTMLFDPAGTGGQREQLMVALQDYMENSLFPRLARSTMEDVPRGETTDGVRARVRGDGKKAFLRGERRESAVTTETGTERETKKRQPERDADYLRRSLEQIAAGREKEREGSENWLKELSPEQMAVIGDIVRQYLA